MQSDWFLAFGMDILKSANDISYIDGAETTHALLNPSVLLFRYCYPPRANVLLQQELKAIQHFLAIQQIIQNHHFHVMMDADDMTQRKIIPHTSILTPFVESYESYKTNITNNTDIMVRVQRMDASLLVTAQIGFDNQTAEMFALDIHTEV